MVGGAENVKLRQAISQAINRDEINDAIYDGIRTVPTGGHARRASRASRRTSASTAPTTRTQPSAAFEEWKAAGNALTEPIKIQFNADAGHEDVVRDHRRQPRGQSASRPWPTRSPTETYFSRARRGRPACSAGPAGTPTTRRTTTSCSTCSTASRIGGNNYGFDSNDRVRRADRPGARRRSTLTSEANGCTARPRTPAQRGHRRGADQLYHGDYVYTRRWSPSSRRRRRADRLGAGRAQGLIRATHVRSGGAAAHPDGAPRAGRCMTELHHPPDPAHHPDGLRRALLPVLPLLPPARRPGDADRRRRRSRTIDPGVVERIEERYGLDDPLLERSS